MSTVSLAATSKRQSRVGVEGRKTSSESRIPAQSATVRKVQGTGCKCHVVPRGQRPWWNKEGGGLVDNTYPLADAQGVRRLCSEGHKDGQGAR
jgi:hypothetical protein